MVETACLGALWSLVCSGIILNFILFAGDQSGKVSAELHKNRDQAKERVTKREQPAYPLLRFLTRAKATCAQTALAAGSYRLPGRVQQGPNRNSAKGSIRGLAESMESINKTCAELIYPCYP